MKTGGKKSEVRKSLMAMVAGAAIVLLFANCSTSRQAARRQKDYFVLTNAMVEGKSVQVVKSTFGLGIQPTASDVFIQFGTNGFLTVKYDPTNMVPRTILLETVDEMHRPKHSVYDLNADGIPEIRFSEDEEDARQVYYQGEWHDFRRDEDYLIITNKGKALKLFFDGEKMQAVSGRREKLK